MLLRNPFFVQLSLKINCLLFEIKCAMRVDNPPFVFYFRVKFYVAEPSKLKEEYTRYSSKVLST